MSRPSKLEKNTAENIAKLDHYILLKMLKTRKKFDLEKSGVTSLVK